MDAPEPAALLHPHPAQRAGDDDACPMGFALRADPAELELDSDVRAVILDGVVSFTPISGDMTSAVPVDRLANWESGC